jgi:uncharacterized membrane protein (DUF2068 family)
MKGLRRVKWENIFVVLYLPLNIYQLYYHINLNGLYIGLIAEIVISIISVVGLHYIIKDIRKNPSNWLFD